MLPNQTAMRISSGRIVIGGVLTLVVAIGIANRVRAGEGCCAHCGRDHLCQKVCRLVCEEKKITTTCWGCKEEDFCIPGPSKPGCKHCEMVCDEGCDPKAPCVQPKRLVWREWIPGGCATVYTKKKLMKRTVTTTVPSYKWVVEDLCPQCESSCAVVNVPPGTEIPPAPAVNAKQISGKRSQSVSGNDAPKR